MQVPNGDLTVKQLRFLGDCIKPLEGGCGDITTRANIQLRGVTLNEASLRCTSAQHNTSCSICPGARSALLLKAGSSLVVHKPSTARQHH